MNSNWIKTNHNSYTYTNSIPSFKHSSQQQFLLFKQYWFVCWETAWFSPECYFTGFVYFLKSSRWKDAAVEPPTWIINSKLPLTPISLLATCASWGMTTQVLCLYFLSQLENFLFLVNSSHCYLTTGFSPVTRCSNTWVPDGIKWLRMYLLSEHKESCHLVYFFFFITNILLLRNR